MSAVVLDHDGLAKAVRLCLGDPGAKIIAVESLTLPVGFSEADGAGLGMQRLKGRAAVVGAEVDFAIVVKTLGMTGQDSDYPRMWNYWKREPLAYSSGILEQLPDGLRAPVCYGVSDGGDRATIFMEELPGNDAVWGLAEYEAAARELGRFNGAYLAGLAVPEADWLLPGRTANWLDLAAPVVATLPGQMGRAVTQSWLGEGRLARTLALWHRRGELQALRAGRPRCLCHHDAHRRNLMLTEGGLVGVDWSMIGPGVVGEELMALIGVALQFGDVPMAQAQALEAAVLRGYHAGLCAAGAQVSIAEVRLGYAASTCLVLGLGVFGVWGADAGEEHYREMVEQILGAPMAAIGVRFGRLQDFVLRLGEEVLAG